MIRVSNLSFAFAEKKIFNQLSFSVVKGEIISLIGPNGCGKSTLLRLLRGQLKVVQGEISWDNIPVDDITAKTMARKVAVVPQSTHIDFPYRVIDVVSMGRYPHRKNLLSFSGNADKDAVNRALAVTDIVNLAERPVTQLSGGELQRVFLARALAQSADVLFLDEATSHLDIDHRLEFSKLLLRLNRDQGTTIVQISHDLDLAAAISQRILLLTEDGEIAALGSPKDVMTADNLKYIFRVDVKVENNPFTGAPQIHPLINASFYEFGALKIHLMCGGGSGKTLMRKLHLAHAEMSVGPLNQGDTDESIATALGIPQVLESPFIPYSPAALKKTQELIDAADILIVATLWWGPGNLNCLDLVRQALNQKKAVYFVNSQQDQDYTGGEAWTQICRLKREGAVLIENEELLLKRLEKCPHNTNQE